MPEEIEITLRPDGTEIVKVISSTGDCKALTKPFEKDGKVAKDQDIPNPGLKDQTRLKGKS